MNYNTSKVFEISSVALSTEESQALLSLSPYMTSKSGSKVLYKASSLANEIELQELYTTLGYVECVYLLVEVA